METVSILKKKKVLVFLALFIFISIGFTYFYFVKTDSEEKVTYQTAGVKKGDIRITVEQSGTVGFKDQMDIISSANGVVSQLLVNEGDLVKVGDPILTIDGSETQISIEQAKNDLQIAQLKLNNLLSSTKNIESSEAIITLPVSGIVEYNVQEGMNITENSQIGTIQNDKKIRVKATIDTEYINQLENGKEIRLKFIEFDGEAAGRIDKIANISSAINVSNKQTVDMWISLNQSTTISEGMLTEIEIKTEVGEISGIGTIEEMEKVAVYPKTSGTIMEIYIDNKQYGEKGENYIRVDQSSLLNDINSQKLTIKNLELKLQQLELEKDQLTIKSPINGKVKELLATPNQAINSNAKLATITDNSLVAKLNIDEIDIGKVQISQAAELSLAAFQEELFEGEVSYISDIGIVQDGITSYPVEIALKSETDKIKDGMTVDGAIIITEAKNALLVPSTSIVKAKDGEVVRVIEDGQLKVKKVKTGISNDTLTVIKEGISLTDTVVTSITMPQSADPKESSSLIPSSVPIPGISNGGGKR